MSEQELNEKWNTHKVMREAVESAHIQSAPETRERLKALETSDKFIMEKLDKMDKDNQEAHRELTKVISRLEIKLDKALDGKANKWVEKIIVWAGTIIGVGLLGFLGTLLVKLIEL